MKERVLMPEITEINITTDEMAACEKAHLNVKKFLREINQNINAINLLITQYNQIEDSEQSRNMLQQIMQAQKHIDTTLPLTYFEHIKEARDTIHRQLVWAIQQQASLLNIRLSEDVSLKKSQIPNEFSEAIALLTPQSIDKMLEILSNSEPFYPQKLEELYTPYEPDNKDHQIFKSLFIKNYTIKPLGGANSKNFLISSTEGELFVLKVENRLGTPKSADKHLSNNALAEVLTPVSIERNGSFINNSGHLVTRTLAVTEYCSGGDLLTHARQLDDNARMLSALNLYIEMATIVEKIRLNGGAFTDMKNTNWLLDAEGKLKIADTKGLLHSGPNERINFRVDKNRWYNLATTTAVTPPDCYLTEKNPSIDKIHAYMLGKNLYQYVTKCSMEDFYYHDNQGKRTGVIHNAQELPSIINRHPVFQTKAGIEARAIILQLIVEEPSARISVGDAIKKMQNIKNSFVVTSGLSSTLTPDDMIDEGEATLVYEIPEAELVYIRETREACNTLLKDIASLAKYHSTVSLTESFRVKKDLLDNASSMPELEAIKDELTHDLSIFQSKQRCDVLLAHINSMGIYTKDRKLAAYVANNKQTLPQINELGKLHSLENELERCLKTQIMLNNTVQTLRNKARFFTIGKLAAARNFADKITQTDVSQREQLLTDKDKKTINDPLSPRQIIQKYKNINAQAQQNRDENDENNQPNSFN